MNSHTLITIVALSVILATTQSIAKTLTDIPRYALSDDQFSERTLNQREVSSASMIVGMQAGSLSFDIKEPVIYLSGLADSHQHICLQIESRSGSYLGVANFRNPQLGSQLELVLPIKQQDAFRKKISGELVLKALVSEDSSCLGSDEYLTASWQLLDDTNQDIHVFVNIGTVDIATFSIVGQRTLTECKPVKHLLGMNRETFQRYSFVCTQPQHRCITEKEFEIIIELDTDVLPESGKLLNQCS